MRIPFNTADAALAEGLSWELEYAADAVILKVAGGPAETSIDVSRSGDDLTLTWGGGGELFSAPSLDGPWTEAGSGGSFSEPISTTGNRFYRVQ